MLIGNFQFFDPQTDGATGSGGGTGSGANTGDNSQPGSQAPSSSKPVTQGNFDPGRALDRIQQRVLDRQRQDDNRNAPKTLHVEDPEEEREHGRILDGTPERLSTVPKQETPPETPPEEQQEQETDPLEALDPRRQAFQADGNPLRTEEAKRLFEDGNYPGLVKFIADSLGISRQQADQQLQHSGVAGHMGQPQGQPQQQAPQQPQQEQKPEWSEEDIAKYRLLHRLSEGYEIGAKNAVIRHPNGQSMTASREQQLAYLLKFGKPVLYEIPAGATDKEVAELKAANQEIRRNADILLTRAELEFTRHQLNSERERQSQEYKQQQQAQQEAQFFHQVGLATKEVVVKAFGEDFLNGPLRRPKVQELLMDIANDLRLQNPGASPQEVGFETIRLLRDNLPEIFPAKGQANKNQKPVDLAGQTGKEGAQVQGGAGQAQTKAGGTQADGQVQIPNRGVPTGLKPGVGAGEGSPPVKSGLAPTSYKDVRPPAKMGEEVLRKRFNMSGLYD